MLGCVAMNADHRVGLQVDIELPIEDEMDAIGVQLRRDVDHLRKLKRGLERTIDLIHRANRAYMESKELVDRPWGQPVP
jgi:hypothetical protein